MFFISALSPIDLDAWLHLYKNEEIIISAYAKQQANFGTACKYRIQVPGLRSIKRNRQYTVSGCTITYIQ
jgi:hypothetical protein